MCDFTCIIPEIAYTKILITFFINETQQQITSIVTSVHL